MLGTPRVPGQAWGEDGPRAKNTGAEMVLMAGARKLVQEIWPTHEK